MPRPDFKRPAVAAAVAWLAIAAAAMATAPAWAAAVRGSEQEELATRLKPDFIHGSQLFEGCTACHGTDGGGEANGSVPRISSQHPQVLIKQLIDFRDGKRWDLRMEQVASRHRLDDAQSVADVAGYIAMLAPTLPPDKGAGAELARGTMLYARRCAECHGPQGQGAGPKRVPRIAGQHAAYLMRQLQETASGGRPNMSASHQALLGDLALQDFQGLAEFLSRLPVGG